MVGGVDVAGGADEDEEAGEPDEPGAPRRKPNPWVASLAGTPWASRQLVNLARAAAVPPAPLGAVVEVVGPDAVRADPPHPVATAARVRTGRARNRTDRPEAVKGRRTRIRHIFQATTLKKLGRAT